MPTDKKISQTLTFLNNEDGPLSSPVSYTAIDVFKPQDVLLKRLNSSSSSTSYQKGRSIMDPRAKREQTDKGDIRCRESLVGCQISADLKAELDQSQTQLSIMNSHYQVQPIRYQPYHIVYMIQTIQAQQLQAQENHSQASDLSFIQLN